MSVLCLFSLLFLLFCLIAAVVVVVVICINRFVVGSVAVNGELKVPRFADCECGYVLAIRKVCTYSQSSAWPDFSDYRYSYV